MLAKLLFHLDPLLTDSLTSSPMCTLCSIDKDRRQCLPGFKISRSSSSPLFILFTAVSSWLQATVFLFLAFTFTGSSFCSTTLSSLIESSILSSFLLSFLKFVLSKGCPSLIKSPFSRSRSFSSNPPSLFFRFLFFSSLSTFPLLFSFKSSSTVKATLAFFKGLLVFGFRNTPDRFGLSIVDFSKLLNEPKDFTTSIGIVVMDFSSARWLNPRASK